MQADLAIFDEVKAEMEKYKKINAELVFDYEDEQGNKDARKHVKNMRKIITAIAAVHKKGKAAALAVGRLYDAEKNENTAEVLSWIAVHNDPIKEIEEREEAERQAKIDAEIKRQEEEAVAKQKEIEEREAEVNRKEAELKAKEDESRRVEREQQIRFQAAAEATKEANAAAAREKQRIIDAQEARSREAEEAIAKVKADAEQAIKDAEAKALAEKKADEVETARLKQINDERLADIKHCEDIDRELAQSIVDECLPISLDHAKLILSAMKKGKIKHVTINY